MPRKLAAGNWKMNGLQAMRAEIDTLIATHPSPDVDILICPPATLLASLASASDAISLGGQDCHAAASGAHTGDISAAMLADAGAAYVITGHSERRTDHGETDAAVCAKSVTANTAGLTAVICVGETLGEREDSATLDVIAAQLAGSIPQTATAQNTVVAYEPVWAIGTGKVPTLEQIGDVHDFIRRKLTQRFGAASADDIRLLYGGSVKGSNAADIFAISNVDGALVGGASLKAADFSAIISALEAS